MSARAWVIAWACAAGVLPALAPRAHADASTGGPFLLPRYGARAWGMAGAVVAGIDDESAVDWNPAGLARAQRAAGISYVELVPGAFLNQAQAAFVTPISHDRNLETGVTRYTVGAMYSNLSADVGEGETYTENHLRVAIAYAPQPMLTFAIAGEAFLARTGVEDLDAWGTGVDMAATVQITRTWSAALVARDAFSRYSFSDGRDGNKRREFVTGIAHRAPGDISVEADFMYVHDGWLRTLVGAESPYIFGRLALRGGIALLSAGEGRAQYSFGMSVRAEQHVVLHYAASIDDENAMGTVHRLSLGAEW